jgi:hypothetical protein
MIRDLPATLEGAREMSAPFCTVCNRTVDEYGWEIPEGNSDER